MSDQEITFRNLIHPLGREEFFKQYYGKKPIHIPGPSDKFAHIFSWEAFNRLLNTTVLWSDQSVKMALDGRHLAPDEFCRAGLNRECQQAMVPDPARVAEHLRQGATLVLDLIERLTPELGAVASSLEMVTGAPAGCNAYCSWEEHQGFGSHFDTMDVFALHIDGHKTWRLYEGRAEEPVEMPGHEASSFPPEHHERAKGRLLREVEMTPGDLLYIPRGQYHDALASSGATLHLSFGVTFPTGHDFLGMLVRSLPKDPLFRESLPHYEDVEAHRAHLRRLAERLHEIVTDPKTSARMRDYQRQRAARNTLANFALPSRDHVELYRVRAAGAGVVRRGDKWVLKTPSGQETLTPEEARMAERMLERDYLTSESLARGLDEREWNALGPLLEKLAGAGVIERY